jgi:hypothetical protein
VVAFLSGSFVGGFVTRGGADFGAGADFSLGASFVTTPISRGPGGALIMVME